MSHGVQKTVPAPPRKDGDSPSQAIPIDWERRSPRTAKRKNRRGGDGGRQHGEVPTQLLVNFGDKLIKDWREGRATFERETRAGGDKCTIRESETSEPRGGGVGKTMTLAMVLSAVRLYSLFL
jgi:hypothetical protein